MGKTKHDKNKKKQENNFRPQENSTRLQINSIQRRQAGQPDTPDPADRSFGIGNPNERQNATPNTTGANSTSPTKAPQSSSSTSTTPSTGASPPAAQRRLLLPLAEPRVQSMGAADSEVVSRQKAIMKHLNDQVEKIPAGQRREVYRLGSVVVSSKSLSMQENLLPVPNGVENGAPFVRGNNHLKRAIEANILETLQRSGQLAYLQQRGFLDDPNWVMIVDVDFYYDRPKDRIVFHKDTVGRTMFVNLNFNNDNPIIGPEYVVNPPIIQGHLKTTRLHPSFQQDLQTGFNTLELPSEIKATQVPANGIVSFVDELVHHSTPYRGHRGIHISQMTGALLQHSAEYRSWKVANDFTNLVKSSLPQQVFSRDSLKQTGLDGPLFNFLFDGITNHQMKQLLNGNQEYQQMKDKVAKFQADQQAIQNEVQLVSKVENVFTQTSYSRQDLKDQFGLNDGDITALFQSSPHSTHIHHQKLRELLNTNQAYLALKQRVAKFQTDQQAIQGEAQFVSMVENTSTTSIHWKGDLQKLGLQPHQIAFLFPDPINMERIRLKLNGSTEYNQMLQKATKYQAFATKGFIQKEELVSEGLLSQTDADALFAANQKPDLSKVSLATVSGDVDFPEGARLKRQLSQPDLLTFAQKSGGGKRQFFRTWVQAVHKSELQPAAAAPSKSSTPPIVNGGK